MIFPFGAWSQLGAGGRRRSAAARNSLMLPASPILRKRKVGTLLHRMAISLRCRRARHFACPPDGVQVRLFDSVSLTRNSRASSAQAPQLPFSCARARSRIVRRPLGCPISAALISRSIDTRSSNSGMVMLRIASINDKSRPGNNPLSLARRSVRPVHRTGLEPGRTGPVHLACPCPPRASQPAKFSGGSRVRPAWKVHAVLSVFHK